MGWLNARLGVHPAAAASAEVDPAVPWIVPYCQEHIAHAALDLPEGAIPLARVADHPDWPAAARVPIERGEAFYLPVRETASAAAAVLDFIELIPPKSDYPEYLDGLIVGPEAGAAERMRDLAAEISHLEATVASARELKRILYAREHELEVEVVNFLSNELELSARHVDGVDEDFWLTGQPEDWCIGEVKGPGRSNAARGDVAALMFHRQNAGRDDTFPGLLVANTFNLAESVEERDRPIPADVTRLARENSILIVRTLDLFRLRALREQGDDRTDELRDAMLKGGWLEVGSDLTVHHHRD